MNRQRGFTLLEVMVALAVFALLAAAASAASRYVLSQQQGLRDRLLAAWLADNHLAERRLSARWVQGDHPYRVVMDGREWQVQQYLRAVDREGLVRVTLTVGLKGAAQPLYRSSTWLGGHDEQP